MFWRSLGFASVALLAGCSAGNVAPSVLTIPVPAATAAFVPARDPPCASNDDCSARALCMPKAATPELLDAEDFLERAMSLQSLVTRLADTASASPLDAILQQVQADLSTYSRRARGEDVAPGADGPPTMEQMQAAAWLQSGATQALMIIGQLRGRLSAPAIAADARKVYADVRGDDTGGGAGLHPDAIIGDLQTFLHDLDAALGPVDGYAAVRMPDGGAPGPDTGVGAMMRYLGPTLDAMHDATSRASAFLDPSKLPQLRNELALLSQEVDLVGKGGSAGTCRESPDAGRAQKATRP